MRPGSPTSKSRLRVRIVPFDLFWAVVAPGLALALRDPALLEPGDFPYNLRPSYEFALATTASALPAFLLFRISEGMSRFFSVRDVLAICGAVAAAVATSSLALFVFTRLEGVPRSTPLICGLVMVAGLLFARTAARLLRGEEWVDAGAPPREAPQNLRRVLLIGVNRFAALAIRLTDSQRPRTTQIVAALDARPRLVGRAISGVKIVGGPDDVDAVIDEYRVHGVDIDEVWLSESIVGPSDAMSARLAERCAARGLRFQTLSQALNLTPREGDAPPTQAPAPMPLSGYFRVKRAFDVLLAAALLVLLLPLALLVAALTLVDVGAPALFWQQRIGYGGRKFLLYKFRTYQAPFDRLGERVPEAARLSRIGRAIRAARLDEIPQLINVLIGDMSIVGPRPLLAEDQPADPSDRLRVRPGITGWAQINGGTIATPEQKNALDAWYVQRASLLLDAMIIVRTLWSLAMGEKLNPAALEEAMRTRAAQPTVAPDNTRPRGLENVLSPDHLHQSLLSPGSIRDQSDPFRPRVLSCVYGRERVRRYDTRPL